jgi:hypothetical protein
MTNEPTKVAAESEAPDHRFLTNIHQRKLETDQMIQRRRRFTNYATPAENLPMKRWTAGIAALRRFAAGERWNRRTRRLTVQRLYVEGLIDDVGDDYNWKITEAGKEFLFRLDGGC